MMKHQFKRGLAAVRLLTAASALAFGLSGCGGGGGGSDNSPPTIRPKTLDGLLLTLDTNVRFEFVRNTGTAPALLPGDVETGTFYYTLGGVQLRQYPNQGGDNSDTRYPDAVSNASYTYRAINESSAVLTMTGIGINDLNTTGGFNANNGSFTYLFNSSSGGGVNNTVVIDLTFASNGSYITPNTTTTSIPGSPNPQWDVIYVPAGIRLVAGGFVPENYNPEIDPNRPSKIVPASLNNLIVNWTNTGIPDPNFDFTVQFVAQATGLPKSNEADPDEIGQGLLRVAGSAVDDAVDYTWRRIAGTDNGVLTITGSNTTFDGVYNLSFMGADNGNYVGEADAGTVNVAEVTGTFFIPAGT